MFGENQTHLQKLIAELGELEQLESSLSGETSIEAIRDRALKVFPDLFANGFSKERLIEEIQLRRGEKQKVELMLSSVRKKLRFNLPGESSSDALVVSSSPGSTTPKPILTKRSLPSTDEVTEEGEVAKLSYQIAHAIDLFYLERGENEEALATFKDLESKTNLFVKTGAELIAKLSCEELKNRTFQLLFGLVREVEEVSEPFITPPEKLNYIAQIAGVGFAIAYNKEKEKTVSSWVKSRPEISKVTPVQVGLFQEKIWFLEFKSRVAKRFSKSTLKKIEKKHADWITRISRLNQNDIDTIEAYITLSMHLEEMRERLTGSRQRVVVGNELKLLAPSELIPEIDRWVNNLE